MADVNLNVNAPAEQASAMAPPTRIDYKILPRSRWVPVGKSNCYLDVDKDILRDALQITPVNNNNRFSSRLIPDALINFVNNLGYPKVVKTLSAIVTNDVFQLWRALTMIINLCLTGKTSAFKRPRALVLQILWGIINRAHIDYVEMMWEELTQSIHSFIKDKKNLALHTQGKKKATPIMIPSIRFTKLIIYYLQSKHKFHPRPDSPLHLPYEECILGYLKFSAKGNKQEVFDMPIPNEFITADIRGEQYYKEYLEKVAKHQRYLAGEEGNDPDSPAPKPAKATKKSKPSVPKVEQSQKLLPPRPPNLLHLNNPNRNLHQPRLGKRNPTNSLSLVDDFVDEGIPKREPRFDDEEADMQKELEESLKSVHDAHRGPLPPVVFREPDSGKFQPLLEVQGKEKEKRRTPMPTEPLGHAESPSIYAELGLTDSDTEFDEEVPHVVKIEAQDEGQAGSNPGDDAEPQPQSSPVVHAGPNLKHMDLEATDVSTQQNPKQMDEGFRDQFFNDKPSEVDNEKTITETNVESMVSVTIHQDTSIIPPMTSPMIDLISRPNSPNDHRPLPATTTATAITTMTITTHPLPPQPQQGTTDSILIKRIVDEIVTDAVDWAIQAPLRNPFRDFLKADMKEILHQRMWETNSYKAHEDHMMLYEAIKKSMSHDHTDELLTDLAEARIKKKKSHDSPKTPPGSPPHQPLLPLPPTDPSGTSGYFRASGSSQLPPPHPPSSTAKVINLHMDDDTTPNEQVHSSDNEDIMNADIPKVNLKQDWWKLLEEDSPATPEPAWSIPSSTLPILTNNWASALASTYASSPENSLLAQTGDMAIFIDWFCKKQGITELKTQHLEGPAFDMSKSSILMYNVNKPLPLGGPPGQVIIQSDFFFNKYLEYLRYGRKGVRHALSISKIKAAYYLDVGIEQMVPDQMWIEEECKYDIAAIAVRTHMQFLSVVRIEVFSMYGYDYMKKIVLRRADLNKHIIMERDFKYLYPSDFEDLYLLNLQVIDSPRAVTLRDKYGVQMIMRFNKIHKFSDGTLHQIDEALDYSVKEFKVNRMNLGLNKRFWKRKDVDRSNEFTFAIQKQLKTMRIFRNLESFVVGRESPTVAAAEQRDVNSQPHAHTSNS
uniref:E-beta-farnesene synthase n=1 Tax=Tanacetum cinerariifolium TaxID=118510 RepID=A0A6L2L7Y4_TANCI|nr:E-beta-farnesene synthase [Tanacetum cinerariifolium]